jgi:HEAT repeat protein
MLTNTAAGNDEMKTGILIPLDRHGRILKKVHLYLSDLEVFLYDTTGAITVLLEALPHADTELILKILPLLGYAGRDRVLGPLYKLMLSPEKDEQVRRLAALQLGMAASLSDDPSAMIGKLIENLNHPEPSVRSGSALALGWEGNWAAVESLVAHLSDPDEEVQASVVAALSSVGDERVFNILRARLESGTAEQQRNILLNLWRFAERNPHVEDVYVGCMDRVDPDLRLDVLCGLAILPLSTTILDIYRQLLADEDPRIRHQILKNLSSKDPAAFDPIKEILNRLLEDMDPRVRQAAIHLFAKR